MNDQTALCGHVTFTNSSLDRFKEGSHSPLGLPHEFGAFDPNLDRSTT